MRNRRICFHKTLTSVSKEMTDSSTVRTLCVGFHRSDASSPLCSSSPGWCSIEIHRRPAQCASFDIRKRRKMRSTTSIHYFPHDTAGKVPSRDTTGGAAPVRCRRCRTQRCFKPRQYHRACSERGERASAHTSDSPSAYTLG